MGNGHGGRLGSATAGHLPYFPRKALLVTLILNNRDGMKFTFETKP